MFLIALTMVAAQPGELAGLPLSVVPVRTELDADDRIGARRTGLLCAPAGATRWRDAAFEPLAAADAVATSLQARGIDAATVEDAADRPATRPARRRLTVVVTAAHVDACVPQHGLVRLVGGRRQLKASGSITLHWRVADPVGGASTIEGDAKAVLADDTAETLSKAVLQAIVTSLADALMPQR